MSRPPIRRRPAQRPPHPGSPAGNIPPISAADRDLESTKPNTDQAAVDMPDAAERERLVIQFEETLRQDRNLSADEREQILGAYSEALKQTPRQLGPPDLQLIRASFSDTIDRLAELGILDNSDKQTLSAEIDTALRELDTDEVRLALEYGRRLEEEGEEAAREWLVQQNNKQGQSQQPPPTPYGSAETGRSARQLSQRRPPPPRRR